jgi:lipopolysaccharide transport system permease protein
MLLYFARQDLAQRFHGNALGLAWAVLAPLLQLSLFALVFAQVFKARLGGVDDVHYVSFLALGMWPWIAFSEGVTRGGTALTDHSALLSKVAIAPWQLVGARVASAFVVHGAGFIVVMLVLWLYGTGVHPSWFPLTLVAWAGLVGLAFGCALLFAVVFPFFRDVQQIVQYLISASMFVSPILYTHSTAPGPIGAWIAWNPLSGLVDGVRNPLLTQQAQGVLPWYSLGAMLVVLALAVWMYRRTRPQIVEFL